MTKTKTNLIRMIRNASDRDFRAAKQRFPNSRRVRGWSKQKLLQLAANQPENIQSIWAKIHDAFKAREQGGKRKTDTLRAKRLKLSQKKRRLVKEERAKFGLIWKLKKRQLIDLYSKHFG